MTYRVRTSIARVFALVYAGLYGGNLVAAIVAYNIRDAIMYGVLTALWFYCWWYRRPPRNRRPRRVTGRVSVRGARLVVVPR